MTYFGSTKRTLGTSAVVSSCTDRVEKWLGVLGSAYYGFIHGTHIHEPRVIFVFSVLFGVLLFISLEAGASQIIWSYLQVSDRTSVSEALSIYIHLRSLRFRFILWPHRWRHCVKVVDQLWQMLLLYKGKFPFTQFYEYVKFEAYDVFIFISCLVSLMCGCLQTLKPICALYIRIDS